MPRALLVVVLALVAVPTAAGSVRLYGDGFAVVDDPYGPPRLVDLAAGRVHALYPAGTSFSIGSGFATAAPSRRCHVPGSRMTGVAALLCGGLALPLR